MYTDNGTGKQFANLKRRSSIKICARGGKRTLFRHILYSDFYETLHRSIKKKFNPTIAAIIIFVKISKHKIKK